MPKIKIPQVLKDWFQQEGAQQALAEFLELENKVTPVFLVNPEGLEGYVLDPLSAQRAIMQYQPPATLSQAAPVQNTWYTILDTTLFCRLWNVGVRVATANETLELRITIDGETITGTIAATAGSTYYAYILAGNTDDAVVFTGSTTAQNRAFIIEGRSIKVEIRKTTATGAGTITAAATYSKLI